MACGSVARGDTSKADNLRAPVGPPMSNTCGCGQICILSASNGICTRLCTPHDADAQVRCGSGIAATLMTCADKLALLQQAIPSATFPRKPMSIRTQSHLFAKRGISSRICAYHPVESPVPTPTRQKAADRHAGGFAPIDRGDLSRDQRQTPLSSDPYMNRSVPCRPQSHR